MSIQIGMKTSKVHGVSSAELANHWGGEAGALASPMMIIFIEMTCMSITDHLLEPDQITVGYRFNINHLAPTPPEWKVRVDAELIDVDGRMMTYRIEVHDAAGKVADGTHTRFAVSNTRFHERMQGRKEAASVLDSTPP
ncbi:thioesterase [Paraburkholderia dipogonis]|uniref:Thioesterase n=1 Tax=Paraburkholderia dipogonis TaxID=1211383 RepID=A0A4Y8MP87_9BURK|nr:hotdog domain-containing protein [Paraburkholderia dipogonis]TFE39185.1 thioesterase [Paraburkholderia dipogonis]